VTDSATIPISQFRAHAGLVFISGQLGFDPETGNIPDDYETEIRNALTALLSVADAAGATAATVLKTTVFITTAADFAQMNAIYQSVFPGALPARSTIVTALAHPTARFEIEAVAHVSG
jgi:2-iminobutanoate/2-iminopropanoate deaminase